MKLIKWFRSFFNERLPQGMTEFNAWVYDVARLSGLPMNDRLRTVTATFILQLPPSCSRFSKRRLANQLKKAAANQVAHEALKLLDEKEKAEKECPVEPAPSVLG